MKKHLLLLLAFTMLLSATLMAQTNPVKRPDGKIIQPHYIDSVVNKLMDTAQVAGLQVGIINNNKIVYLKSYGYKNQPLHQLNDTATCFYAASLSKSLFAYMVMQLVDEGKLNLDKPLYQYLPKPLPEYDAYKDLTGDERWKLITARMCLDHTTGFLNLRAFNPKGNGKLEIFFKLGSRYAYSGEGLMLLQMVIEVITGQKLETLANERIFKPFGMTRTDYIWRPRFESDYALGHDFNGDTLRKRRRTTANAAGSMETTVADYTRFMTAVLQSKSLSRKSWTEMLSPQISINSAHQFPTLDTTSSADTRKLGLTYGLGWGLFNTSYGKAFFKEGHDDGWVHYVLAIPGKNTAYVVMINSSAGESIFKEIYERLSGITIPWAWENYLPYRATVKLPVNTLQQFVGEYNGQLKVIISLINGQLKAESPTTSTTKTNMYATSNQHFFLKTIEAEVDFVKDASGKVIKAIVTDEGEHYELTKTK